MALSRTNSRFGTAVSNRPNAALSYHHEQRQQLSSLESLQQPRLRSAPTLEPATEKSKSICSAIKLVLEPLAASYLDVSDISCSQLQYKLMGTKRYWYRSVKREKTQSKIRWEAKIYRICCQKSTVDALQDCTWYTIPRLANEDVTITSVGFFDTEKEAVVALDAAVKARDTTNPFTGRSVLESELPLELIKYFQVVIVSDIFQRKCQNERLEIIYGLLLNTTSIPTDTQEETTTSLVLQQSNAPEATINAKVRGFSTIGEKVIGLSMWRSLICHLTICAKTPTQWRPKRSRLELQRSLTERFGLSHLANDRALNVNQRILPVPHALAELVLRNQEEFKTKQKVYSVPHFYHGLPDEVKRMIAEKQAKTNQGRTASIAFQKLTTNTEGTFVKKYLKRRRQYLQVAVKLQKLYRSNMHSKTLRRCYRYHLGAMTLQRLFRGYQHRKYAKAYFRVATCAVLIIQSVFRSYKSRKDTRAMRVQYQRATLDLQRVYRGYIARKYGRRRRHLQASATMIEKLARGFMGRRRAQRMFRAKHKRQVVIPACVLIQRIWRGHRDRTRIALQQLARERKFIHFPAALRIQALVRGFLSRRQVKVFYAAFEAAKVIQKFWRSRRYLKKWMELMDLRHKDRMASRIGCFVRCILVQRFIQRETRKRYFQRVVEPSAANIQRVFRGYIARKRLEDTRDRIEAAITLQQMWRSRSSIKMIRNKLQGFRLMLRDAAAEKIQRCYRCYHARQELNFRRLTHLALYGKAALVVQAAWKSFCRRKKLKAFRVCSLIERKACSLSQVKEAREMIEDDIFDARTCLKQVIQYKAKALRRLKEMKEMRIEWERRQPVVEKELGLLTEDDVDRGWGEAFKTEKHVLQFSLELSVEDILSRKQQMREYEEEIEGLRIEIEDLERDMEECMLKETMELELYRDMELQRANAMFAEEKTRRVRLQRIRWGTRNVRKHVILRDCQDLQVLEKEALAKRQVEELGVLAFKKKQFVKRKLEQAIEDAARSRANQNKVMMELKHGSNVLHGFDAAVQKIKTITHEYSFQYELPKTDCRENPDSVMCLGCGRITCDCYLKRSSSNESDHVATRSAKQTDTNCTIATPKSENRLAKRWHYQG